MKRLTSILLILFTLPLAGCSAYDEMGLCSTLGACSEESEDCTGDDCSEYDKTAAIIKSRSSDNADHGPGDHSGDTAH